MSGLIYLAAGGTGGHINAAIALGEYFSKKNFQVKFVSGERPLDYKLFKGLDVLHLKSQALRTKNPLKLIFSLLNNLLSFFKIILLFLKSRPVLVAGAGGYVCGPTLMAAFLLRIPIFIFEQNASMGLTNRLLGYMANIIFLHFQETRGIKESMRSKVFVVGNPTRSVIQAVEHNNNFSGKVRVLVFGGSLGATQINNVIFKLIQKSRLPLEIIHQTGSDEKPVGETSQTIHYQAHKYLDTIQKQYEWCDVIVSRCGASTVSELRIIRKPCFLIPFPQATDNHQWYNAQAFKNEAGFTVAIVNPKGPEDEILKELESFLDDATNKKLKYETNKVVPLSAAEVSVKKMLEYVGFSEKT